MRYENKKIIFMAALVSLLAVGCGKDNGKSTESSPKSQPKNQQISSNDGPASASTEVQEYQGKCKKGEAFAAPSTAPLSQKDLLQSIWGKYELDQVHVHHQATTSDGKYIGAFYAIATRYIGNNTYMGTTDIRETDLKFECDEYNKDSGVSFFSGVNLPIAALVHGPSGRITVFDQGSSMDNPEFNFPLLSEVHFDSMGSAHYKNAVGISGPPYLYDQYLNDVLKRYSAEAKFYMRSNGGFEMRVTWSEQKSLAEGKSFTTETEVVITYKKEE